MASVFDKADALRIYNTGALVTNGGQLDPDLCLGGKMATTQADLLSVRRKAPIQALRGISASPTCGIGDGSLIVRDKEKSLVTFAAPKDDPGEPVEVLDGQTRVLYSADTSKFIRVRRQGNVIQGNETVKFGEVVTNAIGMGIVDDAEATAGSARYRALAFRNQGNSAIEDLTFSFAQMPSAVSDTHWLPASGAGYLEGFATLSFRYFTPNGFAEIWNGGVLREIVYYKLEGTKLMVAASGRGLFGTTPGEGAATDVIYLHFGYRIGIEEFVSGEIQEISDDTIQPTGLTWLVPLAIGSDIAFPTLDPNASVGVWIERVIPPGAKAHPQLMQRLPYSFVRDGETYWGELRGAQRIANDDLVGYWVFCAVNNPPPFGLGLTGASDFTTYLNGYKPPVAGSIGQTVNVGVWPQDRFGVYSTEYKYESISYLASDVALPKRPSGPQIVQLTQGYGGVVLIEAQYSSLGDEENRADTWVIRYTGDGTDPQASDPPFVTRPMNFDQGEVTASERLRFRLTETFLDGQVIKVLVTTSRAVSGVPGLDNIESDNTTPNEIVVKITAPKRVLSRAHFITRAAWKYTPGPIPSDTYVIDAGNNIRIESIGGISTFWADDIMIWRVFYDSGGEPVGRMFIPKDNFSLKNEAIDVAASSSPIQVVSWNGTKLIGVNVRGRRRLAIDVTNKKIKCAKFSQLSEFVSTSSQNLVHKTNDATLFQVYDATDENYVTHLAVRWSGTWAQPIPITQTKTQAEILAL